MQLCNRMWKHKTVHCRRSLDQWVPVRAVSEAVRLLETPVVSSNMVNWRPGAAAEVQQRQSSGSDRRTEGLNCHLETNYRHTLVSTQRDFHAHPKASSCLCLCTYHLSYSFSILSSVFPALIPSEEMTESFFFLLPHLPPPTSSFFCPSTTLPCLSSRHQALFSFSPLLFSTSLPPFSLWAATPRGDICWLAAPL